MWIIDKIQALFQKGCIGGNKDDTNIDDSQLLDENTKELPLSTSTITYIFCSIEQLLDDGYISFISDELRIPVETIKKELLKMTEGLMQDLSCCIEYPYVDMYYRDTYYNYYAKKLLIIIGIVLEFLFLIK